VALQHLDKVTLEAQEAQLQQFMAVVEAVELAHQEAQVLEPEAVMAVLVSTLTLMQLGYLLLFQHQV
jgi:hypothetical protein